MNFEKVIKPHMFMCWKSNTKFSLKTIYIERKEICEISSSLIAKTGK